MNVEQHVVLLKAVEWEKLKGYLRAFAAIDGAILVYDGPARAVKWEALEGKINEFINLVEDEGLHE